MEVDRSYFVTHVIARSNRRIRTRSIPAQDWDLIAESKSRPAHRNFLRQQNITTPRPASNGRMFAANSQALHSKQFGVDHEVECDGWVGTNLQSMIAEVPHA